MYVGEYMGTLYSIFSISLKYSQLKRKLQEVYLSLISCKNKITVCEKKKLQEIGMSIYVLPLLS